MYGSHMLLSAFSHENEGALFDKEQFFFFKLENSVLITGILFLFLA